jgi:hypothetical protein
MFKRATGSAKSRRATESALPLSSTDGGLIPQSGSSSNLPGLASTGSTLSIPTAPPSEPLLPAEHYSHLLTPPLPFEPDFFETFATLCDVLIDAYSRMTLLLTEHADAVGQSTGELFAKADSKVKKVIVSGMMREFEDRARDGMKGEMAGIGKVVLGGLM